MRSNVEQFPSIHQKINKPYHNKRFHLSSKRNLHPLTPPCTPLMRVKCSIPHSFRPTPSSSQPLIPRKHRRNSAPRFSYLSRMRSERTLNRNINACSNKFRNFKGRLRHYPRHPVIPLSDRINDDHSYPLPTHYTGHRKSNSIA